MRLERTQGRASSRALGRALVCAALLLGTVHGCGGASGAASLGDVPANLANPCEGRVQDKAAHPLVALAQPRPGETYRDPAFSTQVTRLTAASPQDGENAVIKPMYSTMPAWNADESLLLLWHRGRGHELWTGDRPYRMLRTLGLRSPSDIEQVLWDPTDPSLLYYPSNLNAEPLLIEHRVSSSADSWRVLHDFRLPPPNCPVDWGKLLRLGSDPQWMGWGPRKLVGLQCGETKFLYSVTQDAVVAVGHAQTQNAPIASPSEKLAYLDGYVFDLLFKPQRALAMANRYEHSSLGRSANGYDVLSAVAFDGSEVGTLVTHRLDTGEHHVVIGPPTGYPYPPSSTHLSAVGQKAPGWVAIGIVGTHTGQTLLDNEIVLANVDTGAVCRVAHARTFAGSTSDGRWGYWSEIHPVLSPTATRILFGSDWMNGPTVDSYVVDLRVR